MKRYYISNPDSEKGFDEVTEAEFLAIIGDDTTRLYASEVYRGTLSMDEVPEDIREAVQIVVNNKIARFGKYSEREISADEFTTMLEEVL